MKGAIVEKPGAPVRVVADLDKPHPGPGQVLVRSVFTGINPVDSYMANYGILVVDWPLVLGCDAAGVVVEADADAVGPLGAALKKGDAVCGCTRLGTKGFGTCQEYFLMDAKVTIPKPGNISLEEAATVGVGAETACLGIFNGLHIPVPDPSRLPSASHEWVLVSGGAGSVGKFALQILAALGYKVLVTGSSKSADLLKSLGAADVVDYKLPEDEQVSKIVEITGGKLHRIFDTIASAHGLAGKVFSKVESGKNYFTTTNDWDKLKSEDVSGAELYTIALGHVGHPDAAELNKDLEAFIPVIYKLIEQGKVRPSEYEVAGHGIDEVEKAWKYQQSGKGGNKKVLVKIGDA